jgi:2-polyprenyl-3-methyl-5-hydroxy-6-metoxy-1,4-benzoquinol methylase
MAAVHGEGGADYYDVEALVAGERDLSEIEHGAVELAVGDVDGKDVLHLQCHIGFDSIVLARRGARVVGTDFSAASLEKARVLAERCGVEVEFVEADSTDLPRDLHGRFDLVYSTVGILTWIGDLDAWMDNVFAVLKPRGRLVLVDLHPFYNTIGKLDPLTFDFPYADTGALTFDEPGSYANRDADVAATTTIQHGHSVGEIVTAALRAGHRVEALAEHTEADFDPRGSFLPRRADGRYELRLGETAFPLLYTLVASRP